MPKTLNDYSLNGQLDELPPTDLVRQLYSAFRGDEEHLHEIALPEIGRLYAQCRMRDVVAAYIDNQENEEKDAEAWTALDTFIHLMETETENFGPSIFHRLSREWTRLQRILPKGRWPALRKIHGLEVVNEAKSRDLRDKTLLRLRKLRVKRPKP